MNRVRFIVMAATTIALVATGAQATVCVKKSGAVVVRDECRKRETPITPTQLAGVQGPTGADGSQGAPGEKGEQGDPGDFRLVDSTGRFVGIVDIGHTDSIAIVVPGVGLGILYSDQDGQGFWQDGVTLYHESTECEGEPLVDVNRYELIQEVDAFANSAYFPVLPGGTRSIKSKEYATNTCATMITGRGLCCEDVATEDRFVARTVGVPLSTLGTPPFHVVY